MNTVLIALAATAAAIALTWFCCMRPMLRRMGAADEACCASQEQSIDDQIRAAKDELSQLQDSRSDAGPDVISPDRREG
jgi:hypothetical protein